MATVKKPFNSKIRRFREDDDVSPRDDLSPHSFEGLVDAGYVERLPQAPKLKKPAKTD